MKKVSLGDVLQKSTLHSFPDEHIIIFLSNKIFTFCKIYDFFKQKLLNQGATFPQKQNIALVLD